jgi:transposase
MSTPLDEPHNFYHAPVMYDSGFRKAAINVYEFVHSIRKTCRMLGIAKSTIQRWLSSSSTCKTTSTLRKFERLDVAACIRKHVEINPFTTCHQLSHLVQKETNVRISRQLASVALKQYGFSKVKARRTNYNHDRQEPQLKTFLKTLLGCIKIGTPIVAVDECGFDARMLPQTGYCKKGCRLRVHDSSSCTWKRQNMIMAVSTSGQWSHVVQEQPVNAVEFSAFIRSLQFPTGTVILMDNIAFHKSPSTRQAMNEKEFTPLYIPPYCPDANPIENVFGIIKQRFRKSFYRSLHTLPRVLNETIVDVMEKLRTFDTIFVHSIVWSLRKMQSEVCTKVFKGMHLSQIVSLLEDGYLVV